MVLIDADKFLVIQTVSSLSPEAIFASLQNLSGFFAKTFWTAMLMSPFCLFLVLILVLVWSNMLPLNRGRVGSGRGMYVHYTSATRDRDSFGICN